MTILPYSHPIRSLSYFTLPYQTAVQFACQLSPKCVSNDSLPYHFYGVILTLNDKVANYYSMCYSTRRSTQHSENKNAADPKFMYLTLDSLNGIFPITINLSFNRNETTTTARSESIPAPR